MCFAFEYRSGDLSQVLLDTNTHHQNRISELGQKGVEFEQIDQIEKEWSENWLSEYGLIR